MKIILSLAASLLFCTLPAQLSAQGEWAPEEASFTRPRLLLTPDQLPNTRQLLSFTLHEQQSIYRDLWTETLLRDVPTDTLSDEARSQNARFAKNAAFILLIDSVTIDGTFSPLPDEARTTLLDNLALSLSRLNPSVSPTLSRTGVLLRSRELLDYLAAWDIATTLEIATPTLEEAADKLQTMARGLYRVGTRDVDGEIWLERNPDHIALNLCGALGSAAIVLNDRSSADSAARPAIWIETALYWSDHLLWRSDQRLSERGGIYGYADGPGAMNEAFVGLLPFWRSLGMVYPVDSLTVTWSGDQITVPHPFTDPSTAALIAWGRMLTAPHGYLSALSQTRPRTLFFGDLLADTYYGYAELSDSAYVSAIRQMEGIDVRANLLATGKRTLPMNSLRDQGRFIATDDSSMITLWSEEWYELNKIRVTALASNSRRDGRTHYPHHADAGSFTIEHNNGPLVIDPGSDLDTLAGIVDRGRSHNLILVDGLGPGEGATPDLRTYTSVINPRRVREVEGLIERVATKYAVINTTFAGVSMERHLFLLDGRQVLVADKVTGRASEEHTWQLHGFASDSSAIHRDHEFSLDPEIGMARWQDERRSLTSLVISSDHDQVFTGEMTPHTTSEGSLDSHRVVRLRATSDSKPTRFLSLHLPEGEDREATGYAVRNGPEVISVVAEGFDTDDVWTGFPSLALHVMTEGGSVHAARAEGATDTLEIETDAEIASITRLGGERTPMQPVAMINGTILMEGRDTIIAASRRTEVIIFSDFADSQLHYAWVGDSGTYTIRPVGYYDFVDFRGDDGMFYPVTGGPGGTQAIRMTAPTSGTFIFWSGLSAPLEREEAISHILRTEWSQNNLHYTLVVQPDFAGTLELYDLRGLRIGSTKIYREASDGRSGMLQLPPVAEGAYILHLRDDNGSVGRGEVIVKRQ